MTFFQRFISVFIFVTFYASASLACEICTIPRLGKQKAVTKSDPWFAEYYFELQDWKEIDPHAAHELHHDGHHVHDKTKEYIHHVSLGGKLGEDVTMIADLPYVIRKSLEIHEHDMVGTELQSEGLGDLHVMGMYRFWEPGKDQAVSALGGIKFPTGVTDEETPSGELFEPELQPGSGSFDYLLGALYKGRMAHSEISTNLIYVFKTEGDQDYEFGDTLITSVLWQYLLPYKKNVLVRLGVDGSLQYEQKHEDHGETINDSGGVTLLLGPVLGVEINEQVSIFGSVHFPAVQNLGGKHQEIDSVSMAGIKLSW